MIRAEFLHGVNQVDLVDGGPCALVFQWYPGKAGLNCFSLKMVMIFIFL